MGTLYVVATPIGNLEDITLRALQVLKSVGLVVSEDTRTTRKLLTRYKITVPQLSYTEYSAAQRVPRILRHLESADAALVSEAGVPGVSDPGRTLVSAAVAHGIRVVPVPGPSALTAALAVSGLPTDSFIFLGFPPRRRNHRTALLGSLAHQRLPLVIFEAPHRVRATLDDLLATLGDRPVAVCREMTKLHEEVFHGTISQAIERFGEPRGEFVLVVQGAPAPGSQESVDLDEVRRELSDLKRAGCTGRDAVATAAATHGISKRHAYRLWLELPAP